ncbi:MAG: PilT/PilU family type 4a pilus ATPase [Sumerlaeia bacterium]
MSDPNILLEAALGARLITRKQLDHIQEEMAAFPGQDAAQLLIRKHFLTVAQLERLKTQMAAQETQKLADPDESRPIPAMRVDAPAEDEETHQISSVTTPRPVPSAQPTSQPQPRPQPPAPSPAVPEPEPPSPRYQDDEVQDVRLPKTLKNMLQLARHWGCSDLHISTGRPPFVRMKGEIRYMEMEPLTPEQSYKLNFQLLGEEQREVLAKDMTLDFALELPGTGRHRCNVFKQRLGWDGSYRIISNDIPTLDQLGMPEVLKTLTEYQQGMVMVTGPGRSGKTTTVAAMIDYVNRTREDHVITVEDPIEYVHPSLGCQVTQREIGPHSESFGMALRAALREDPDIIFVGELRDLETISIAITAAETGHLVFGTLHTSSAGRTINRLLDVYPPSQQQQIRTMVSESLRGVICQKLLPRKGATDQVLCLEVLVVNSAVAQLIRDKKLHQLASAMQAGKRLGMISMDDSLMILYQQGFVTGAEAYRHSENKSAFEPYRNDTT